MSDQLFAAAVVAVAIISVLLAGGVMGAAIGYQRGRNALAKEMLERRWFG